VAASSEVRASRTGDRRDSRRKSASTGTRRGDPAAVVFGIGAVTASALDRQTLMISPRPDLRRLYAIIAFLAIAHREGDYYWRMEEEPRSRPYN